MHTYRVFAVATVAAHYPANVIFVSTVSAMNVQDAFRKASALPQASWSPNPVKWGIEAPRVTQVDLVLADDTSVSSWGLAPNGEVFLHSETEA